MLGMNPVVSTMSVSGARSGKEEVKRSKSSQELKKSASSVGFVVPDAVESVVVVWSNRLDLTTVRLVHRFEHCFHSRI